MSGETTTPDTAAVTIETITANNVYATNGQQVQNRGNINIKNNRTRVDTEDKNYKVDTAKVGGILTLRT